MRSRTSSFSFKGRPRDLRDVGSRLGATHVVEGSVLRDDAARSRVRPAALRALQLDPLLAEAHAAVGWMRARGFDWPDAERSFERALELNRTLTPISISMPTGNSPGR